MKRLGVLVALGLLVSLVNIVPPSDALGAYTALVVGMLLLTGHVAGHILNAVGLPRLTGYLCVGLLAGPYILGYLTFETVGKLKFLNELAVTFIALAAGGELRLEEVRARSKVILLTILSSTFIGFFVVTLFVFVASSLLPFTAGFSVVQTLAVAMLFGVLGVARSPSSAIALIKECRARGPFTETALGVTVVIDVLVIILFGIVLSFAEVVMTGAGVNLGFLISLIVEIVVGIVLGGIIGWGLAQYIGRVKANLPVLLIGTALLVTNLSHSMTEYLADAHELGLRLEPLLICVTAGFTVQNYSPQGHRFIEAVNAVSLPVFVLFFTLAGAGLNLHALQETWGIALLLVFVRTGAVWLGAYTGGRLGGDPPRFTRIAGFAYLTQAGVSLGLALEVVRRFPDWGSAFVPIVVAVIAINQVIGPIAMKQALVRSGEARLES